MKRLILIIVFAVLLTGCSVRAEELEDSAVAKALAIDRGEKGYTVSAYIAGAEEGSVISAEAESIAEAFLLLNTRTERRIFLGQLRVIAVSSDLRDAEEVLLYLYSAEDVRSAAKVLTVDGMAKDVLEYRGLYRDPASDIEKTIENAEKNANFSAVSLYAWVNSMASEAGCCILPVAKMEEENLILEKAVIYRKFRILQTLSAQELAGCMILAEKDRVFLAVDGRSIVLNGIHIGDVQKGSASVQCRYRTAAEGIPADEIVEKSIAEEVSKVCRILHKVGAEFPWMCGITEDTDFTVTARPAGNDYPLRGGKE